MSSAQRYKVAKAQRGSINSVPLCLCALVPDQKGLTLIEVMVVVAILALIASSVFTVFQGSLLSQRRGTNKALIYSEARAALDMMSREIENAMVDKRKNIHYELWDEANPSPYHTTSIGDEFYLVLPNKDGDLIEVGYWLEGDGKDTPLKRHYDPNPDLDYPIPFNFSTGNNDPLIGNVSDLQFEYWGWDVATSQFRFMDPPILGYALPKAVKITLTMKYEIEKEVEREQDFTTVVHIPGSGQ